MTAPRNVGEHYETFEIIGALAMWRKWEGYPPLDVQERLAKVAGRNLGGIEFIFRQIDEGRVIGNDPAKAKNRIQRQIVEAKNLLDGVLEVLT